MASGKKYIETGKRLQAFRKNTLKVTAEDFAAALGVSTSAVNMMEQGWRDVSNATLRKIHKVYNVPVDTIITGTTYKDGKKPKPSDPLTLEIKIAKLEAKVEQLERMVVEVLQSKALSKDQV